MSFEAIAAAADLANMGLVITSSGEKDAPKAVYVSQRIEKLLGRSAQEIRANSVWAYIAEEEFPRLAAIHAERRQHQAPLNERWIAFHQKRVVEGTTPVW